MVSTVVGYTGGSTENPTYYRLGDHSETIQITYDPSVISYGDLLDVFWQSHTPIYPSGSRQYMSAIFYHDDEQKRLAEESRDRLQEETGHRLYTLMIPAQNFYPAEDYHQKYYLRHFSELTDEFEYIYPDINDFVNSTAVTRANGYVGGYGTEEAFEQELDSYGLSERGKDLISTIVGHGLTPVCRVPQS